MTQDNICYLSSTEESKEVWKESINSVVITRPGLLINFDISWWCWITQLEKLGMNMSTLRWYFFDSCITCLLCHFNSIVHWMMSMCRVKSNWHSSTRDFMLWEILWCSHMPPSLQLHINWPLDNIISCWENWPAFDLWCLGWGFNEKYGLGLIGPYPVAVEIQVSPVFCNNIKP